jgi:signal transduction histidine kinase/DNA-binding response OmpR family regulator
MFRNFDIADGLPTNEFRPGSVYRRNGRLLFGSVNGFVAFHPDSIRDNASVPPVYITGFKVMEKQRNVPATRVELRYNENFLSFDFVALNYILPEKNQYAYKMEGIDKDWVYNGTRRFASYKNLDPGDYIFLVKASNNDGVWNQQGASLILTILPPPWRTWWAYSLYGSIGICLLYVLRQNTIKRERLKHELKLQRLEAEKMQEINQLKSRFFANISHEFRTPLTLILGPLEKFLSRTHTDSEDKSLYLMMQHNAGRLLHLINQLLDLSKLEVGSLKLEPQPADLVAFLKATILSFTSLAQSRQIQYQLHFPADHPVMYFDADKLEKILVNLLSNAFKFTAGGGSVSVTVSFQEMPSEKQRPKQMLEITVKDSGIGISPEHIDKVFDRFYQANDSDTKQREGTGIGLALSKELVELHGGEISLDSERGKSATFTVRLPLEVVPITLPPLHPDELPLTKGTHRIIYEESETENTADHPTINYKNKKQRTPLLLVVEDNADIRWYIRENLNTQYQIVEAINGVEALTQAIELMPDLIVSDIMMPMMDGIELCRQLKTNECTSHIPVILLTAKAGEASQLEGLETGADDYLTKPFSRKELKVRIKNLIEQRARLRACFSKKVSVEPKQVAVTSADEKFLQRALAVVEANMANAEFDVETFGREVGMSRTHIHRKLKALTDQSVSEFIRTIRLKRAAQLLSQKAGNVSEIAYLVGFKEQSYFSRCFQQTFGCAPSEYAAKHVIQV